MTRYVVRWFDEGDQVNDIFDDLEDAWTYTALLSEQGFSYNLIIIRGYHG